MKIIILGLIVSLVIVIPGSTIKYVREDPLDFELIKAEVSAYTTSVEETDDTPEITASGSRTRPGIAACPSRLKFGTEIEVNGRRYVCEDRMNPRYTGRDVFDIWMTTKDLALDWGRRHLEIKVFE